MSDDLEDLARAAQSQRRPNGHPPQPRSPVPPPPATYSNPTYSPPNVPTPAGVQRCWTIHDQGRQFGPHTELELASLVAVGTISPTAMAWRDGSPRWIPVSAIVPMPAHLPTANQPMPQSSNRIAIGLVAIFLGALGIHKFMLGRSGAGVAMLLVSLLGVCVWGLGPAVMSIIGFVEGIIYLTKTDAQFHHEYIIGKKAWL